MQPLGGRQPFVPPALTVEVKMLHEDKIACS